MLIFPNTYCRITRLRGFLSILWLCLPLAVFAGDPIPGIGITVEQSPPGINKKGTTNANGEVILSGFQPGQCVVTLVRDGQLAVIGKQASDRIILPGKGKAAAIKPIRLELSSYAVASTTMGKKGYDAYKAQSDNSMAARGNDKVDRKRPGGTLKRDVRDGALDGTDASATRASDYNSSRSNRTTSSGLALDTDDDGDSVPTTRASDYNSSRSNRTTSSGLNNNADNGVDNDCDGIVEILPMPNGRIKITVTCAG